MKTLAWLCDNDRNTIDDTPICTLDVDTTAFRKPGGYFEFEGNKYLFYSEETPSV